MLVRHDTNYSDVILCYQASVLYPIMQGRVFNIMLTTMDYSLEDTIYPGSWVSIVDSSELISLFDGWSEDAKVFVSVCTLEF